MAGSGLLALPANASQGKDEKNGNLTKEELMGWSSRRSNDQGYQAQASQLAAECE
jgi:hypothetical protein